MDDSGEFAVCENCGMKFMRERIKKMVVELSGPVQVDGIASTDSLIMRAREFERSSNIDQAMAYYNRVLDLDPMNTEAKERFNVLNLIKQAKQLESSHNLSEALVYYKKVLDLEPNNVEANESFNTINDMLCESITVIEAPMPGAIISVIKNTGDVVAEGEVVLTLEAMKMENEIVAPVAGTIDKIKVAKGMSVKAYDYLYSIKE